MIEMPKLRPIPIETKDVPWFIALRRWLFRIRKWEVLEEWSYVLPGAGKVKIIIPKGFEFDGASIPRPFRPILSPTGLLLIPGLIHDYAYRYDCLLRDNSKGGLAPYRPYRENKGRHDWDLLFRDVAIEVNGFKVINYIAWFALVVFGGFAWNKHEKGDHQFSLQEPATE